MKTVTVLPTSESFLAACKLVNQVPLDRLPAFLGRVISALTKNERAFTDAEDSKLMQITGLSPGNLDTLIDACSLIFERAARLSLTASNFTTLLSQTGLPAVLVAAFENVWTFSGPALVSAFKERSVGVPGCSLLVDVKWHIHLQVAGRSFGQLCEPSAVMELNLISQDKENATKVHRNLVLELSSDELFSLYDKLEKIQEQLDRLS